MTDDELIEQIISNRGAQPLPSYYAVGSNGGIYHLGYGGQGVWTTLPVEAERAEQIQRLLARGRLVRDTHIPWVADLPGIALDTVKPGY